jgi:uncharacterized membrane protein
MTLFVRSVLAACADVDEHVTSVVHSCDACRVIDQADGIEDGKLFKVSNLSLGNENKIVATIRRTEDKVADKVTAFAGSLNFVYIHAAWFIVWILLNAGAIGAGLVFDEFPYGLLTMVVSLEAIFLATFVMVSQNRQAIRSDIRADLDFETNLRSEIWSVHIGQALGIDAEHVESVVRAAIAGYRSEGTEPD